MKTLNAIILATALSTAACRGAPAPEIKHVTIVGVPMDVAQRTQVSHQSMDYYTFPIKVGDIVGCARHPGVYDFENDEYDAMVISMAYKEHRPVSFQTEGFTSNGCYMMATRPQPVTGQR